ncbi:hypothetical protein SAMN04488522_106124 [Pedobacter caeni]|uniref:Uncharacterized protein n=1 Tax=Pedobacter caeni TaxID=288992 RepID=A0A1M5KWY4_9SPHI|nr:hypothetical protein SAMN04488522_106124 [Pedobacter caeni]
MVVLLIVAAKAPLKLFVLTGIVSGKNGQLVSLVDESGEVSRVLCTVTIQNNQFRLSCKVEQKALISLVFGEGKEKTTYPIMLEEGYFSFSDHKPEQG